VPARDYRGDHVSSVDVIHEKTRISTLTI